MPYKSKRTRDLQGEVVAGTGITITEQTKPDGTKEYTITNGDPASAITVDGTGLSLISNVLRNTMAAIMGWSGDDSRGAINWTDDNGDIVLKIIPLTELFIGDAHDNNDFIIKHINGENRLIRGTLQIAENINSTEGVSLQTLADVNDSAIQAYMDFIFNSTRQEYFVSDIGSNFTNTTYYDLEETPLWIEDDAVYGAKPNKSGIYAISTNFTIKITSTNNIPLINIWVLRIDGSGNYDYQEFVYPTINLGSNEYISYININTFVELINDSDYISLLINTNNTVVSAIQNYGADPTINIKRVG